MKISQKEDFALILMTYLARNYSPQFIPLSTVSKNTHLSSYFLKHIASDLKNKGLIKSREGVTGGYRLARAPQKISAEGILSAVGKAVVRPACYQKDTCRINKKGCFCYSFWDDINKKMSRELKNVSLSDLAGL